MMEPWQQHQISQTLLARAEALHDRMREKYGAAGAAQLRAEQLSEQLLSIDRELAWRQPDSVRDRMEEIAIGVRAELGKLAPIQDEQSAAILSTMDSLAEIRWAIARLSADNLPDEPDAEDLQVFMLPRFDEAPTPALEPLPQ